MSILVNWLESLHQEIIVTSKCVRERNRKSTCGYCLEKCEHEAIVVKRNQLFIDTNKCTMCGECIIACPLSAIEGIVNNRAFEKGSLVFDSNYVPTIKELLIYKKRGMTSIQAPQPLSKDWEIVLFESNSQLQLLDESPFVVVEKVTEEVLSRRALFGSLQKEGKQLAKKMAPASWKMEKDDWKITKYYPNYQFYSVMLNIETCTLCQACFTICPEKLFHIKDSKLMIESEKCVNCTSCTDVCPENALVIVPEIKRKSEDQRNIHQKACKNCGHTFFTFDLETEKCHVCMNRDPDWLSPY
jgi:ferredoxin